MSEERILPARRFQCRSIITGRLHYLFSYFKGVKSFVCFEEWILFNIPSGAKSRENRRELRSNQ